MKMSGGKSDETDGGGIEGKSLDAHGALQSRRKHETTRVLSLIHIAIDSPQKPQAGALRCQS
jgi:hypothetical protein